MRSSCLLAGHQLFYPAPTRRDASRPVARFAADADLRPCRRKTIGGSIVILLHAG